MLSILKILHDITQNTPNELKPEKDLTGNGRPRTWVRCYVTREVSWPTDHKRMFSIGRQVQKQQPRITKRENHRGWSTPLRRAKETRVLCERP